MAGVDFNEGSRHQRGAREYGHRAIDGDIKLSYR
jgi:hypothetical protein